MRFGLSLPSGDRRITSFQNDLVAKHARRYKTYTAKYAAGGTITTIYPDHEAYRSLERNDRLDEYLISLDQT